MPNKSNKYRVNRSCGHIEYVELYGPYRWRQKRIEHERGRLCYKCWQRKHTELKAIVDDANEKEDKTGKDKKNDRITPICND